MLRLALAALMTSALFSYACGADNTHIDNNSKWTILVTTSYPGGDSEFIKRAIAPGGSDVDTYSPVAYVNLDVQVQDAEFSNHFQISSDQSVVAQDTPDNMYGVDFYLNDGDGNPQLTITDPLGLVELPGLLVTIFGPGPPPAPPAPDSPSAPDSPPAPEAPSFPPVPDDDVHTAGPSAAGLYVTAYDKQGGDIKGRLFRSIGSIETLSTTEDQASCGDLKSCFICQEPCNYLKVQGLSGGVPSFFKFDVTATAFNGDRSVFVTGPHRGSNGNDLEVIDDRYFQPFDKVTLVVDMWGIFPPSPPPSPPDDP